MGEIKEKNIWWKEVVAYQIYPRSFQDSNGDGIGDIQGIISRLDYLKDLGIGLIWICPIYKSPQDDNGYDISDYQNIHSEFGTLEDFDLLLREAHRRGIRVIIDLVINHTSDEHPWFLESRKSKTNEKRDWYVWREGKDGQEPNNWESIFSGSAWEKDQLTDQYYLHLFSKKQPDLNWENPKVRQELYKMICWWMDHGIDGFRIDAISHIKKKEGFPDLPAVPGKTYVPSYSMHMNVDGIQKYIEELCENTFRKYDVVTVGEANGVSSKDALDWVGENQKKFSMLFQFEHIGLWNKDPNQKIELKKLKDVFERWQSAMQNDGWNALYIENHDIVRAVSKWGNDSSFWSESAKALAAMYFLMKGTPFIYQGQEIGMTNVKFESLSDFQDVSAKNWIREQQKEGKTDQEILNELCFTSRDNARTPMQWSSEKNAGFSSGVPWLLVNKNYPQINVENQWKNPDSVLNFYKNLIKLRSRNLGWVYGNFQLLNKDSAEIFAYSRRFNGWTGMVVCNLSTKKVQFSTTETNLKLVLCNYRDGDKEQSFLRPYEARIYENCL